MSLHSDQPTKDPIRKSYVIAGVIFLVLVIYVASGAFSGSAKDGNTKSATTDKSDATAKDSKTALATNSGASAILTVRVQTIISETRRQDLVVRGQSEALRKVVVRTETAGKVAAIKADRGDHVKAGATICKLNVDERLAMLKQARAVMKQRQLEYDASKHLMDRGFRSETAMAGDQAEFEAAKAQVERVEKEFENTNLKAPFDGVIDARMADVGDYLAPGQPCALVIDQDPFLIVGQASEKDVGLIHDSDAGWAKLVTGEKVEGKVRFVSKSADAATRTFRVELEIPNKNGAIRDGVTAEMHITGAQVEAHRISPAILALDEKGALGVRIVDEKKHVKFVLVKIVADTPQGIWVSGLPKKVMIITVGQDYVTNGQVVNVAEDKVSQL